MKKFFLILSVLIITTCSDENLKPVISDTPAESEIPAHESWNSRIVFSNDGILKAILYADHLRKYDEKKITLLEGVKIDFYDKNKKTTTLTSLRGKVDDRTMDMFAYDSVMAVNDSGTVLTTSELMWRNSDKKILTDKFVSIRSKDEIIEGYGFLSDQQMSNYTIFRITYSAIIKNGNER
ncbi:LPS export ABC transporter periplasmic protein LptC [Melioribacter sp. OK-6-Me]|uniref:LPS export ABC transporter periplasmic protein LptC n=1 Tax=unclassified Melioribacter TaxID=2627329 RepID=UPI003ED88F3E